MSATFSTIYSALKSSTPRPTPAQAMAMVSTFAAGVMSYLRAGAHITALLPEDVVDGDGNYSPSTLAQLGGSGGAAIDLASAASPKAYLASTPVGDPAVAWRRSQDLNADTPAQISIVFVPAVDRPANLPQIFVARNLMDKYQAALDIVSSDVWIYGTNPIADPSLVFSKLQDLATNLDAAGEFPPQKMVDDLPGAFSAATAATAQAVDKIGSEAAKDTAKALNWAAETAADATSAFIGNLSPLVLGGLVAYVGWKFFL